MKQEERGEEEHERRRWHFKKELSLGDLIAVATTVGIVLTSLHSVDKRISALEEKAIAQKSVDTRQDEEALRYQTRFENALKEINNKLDRLIERRADERK